MYSHETDLIQWFLFRYGQPDTISTLLEYGINIDVDNQVLFTSTLLELIFD